MKFIGIGWDVGGWMGSNHGLAICEWNMGEKAVHWIGTPTEISLPQNNLLTIEDMFKAVCPNHNLGLLDDSFIVIGVDAPLGYPVQFKKLLLGEEITVVKPEKEIKNCLAYRYTDQEIYRVFGKKPLSATFDRIGNNCTSAILHARKWEMENKFKTYPFREPEASDNKIIIEVYPALLKPSRYSAAIKGISRLLPKIEPGTDAYDACICALYAIAFGTKGTILPLLKDPPQLEAIKDEGWIYFFDKDATSTLK